MLQEYKGYRFANQLYRTFYKKYKSLLLRITVTLVALTYVISNDYWNYERIKRNFKKSLKIKRRKKIYIAKNSRINNEAEVISIVFVEVIYEDKNVANTISGDNL